MAAYLRYRNSLLLLAYLKLTKMHNTAQCYCIAQMQQQLAAKLTVRLLATVTLHYTRYQGGIFLVQTSGGG